jgi:hypothetical protein
MKKQMETTMDDKHIPILPPLSLMLFALRGIGYSLETAIADLIDNSISAFAKHIDVSFSWRSDNNDNHPYITIFDDGQGMSREQILTAMNFSSSDITTFRAETDLGRFGLGLKLASFSQCRVVSVVSKKDGVISCFRWDLNLLQQEENNLFVIEGMTATSSSCLHLLDGVSSGTIVVWEDLDKILSTTTSYDLFISREESVESHLSMVFHRFLEDGDFVLTVQGVCVKPWSPFPRNNPAAQYFPIAIIGMRNNVLVQGCILPPHENVATPELYQIMGGNKGWISQEGFYIYRNKRLLVAGSWLGLGSPRWIQEEAYSLARIRIDISNRDDFSWNIDVKKSAAKPPEDCFLPLEKIGEEVRRKARETYLHRGNYQKAPMEAKEEINPWGKRDGLYYINMESPFIKKYYDQLSSEEKKDFKKVLQIIELSVPVRQIMITESEKNQGLSYSLSKEERSQKVKAIKVILSSWIDEHQCSLEEAVTSLSNMELFYDFSELIQEAKNLIVGEK